MRITSKGQVTIPQQIREKFGFYPNTEIDFREENGKVYLVKPEQPSFVRESPFDYVRGKATVRLTTDEIMKLTRSDEE